MDPIEIWFLWVISHDICTSYMSNPGMFKQNGCYWEGTSLVHVYWSLKQECDPFYKMDPSTVAQEILASHDSDKVNPIGIHFFLLCDILAKACESCY